MLYKSELVAKTRLLLGAVDAVLDMPTTRGGVLPTDPQFTVLMETAAAVEQFIKDNYHESQPHRRLAKEGRSCP